MKALFVALMIGLQMIVCGANAQMGAFPIGDARRMDMRIALFTALRSPSGAYKGELTGDFAEFARKNLKLPSTAKVWVEVKTIGTIESTKCHRMHADITIPELKWIDKSGVEQSFAYQYEINLCPDGSPPVPAEDSPANSFGVMPQLR